MQNTIPSTIGITKFRDNIAFYLKRINFTGKPAIILAKNRPLGIILPMKTAENFDTIPQQNLQKVNIKSDVLEENSLQNDSNDETILPFNISKGIDDGGTYRV